MRRTWRLRPSWSTSSIRDGPSRRDARRRRRPVLELDALGEPTQHGVAGLALDVRDVGLLDLVARMGEPVGERRRRS